MKKIVLTNYEAVTLLMMLICTIVFTVFVISGINMDYTLLQAIVSATVIAVACRIVLADLISIFIEIKVTKEESD